MAGDSCQPCISKIRKAAFSAICLSWQRRNAPTFARVFGMFITDESHVTGALQKAGTVWADLIPLLCVEEDILEEHLLLPLHYGSAGRNACRIPTVLPAR